MSFGLSPFAFPEQLLGSTGEVARALPTSGRVCSSPLLCGEVHGLWLRMVKFGVSGKSEGPGPMDFMVLTTFRFIQKSWNAAIVKVVLEFAKKGPSGEPPPHLQHQTTLPWSATQKLRLRRLFLPLPGAVDFDFSYGAV
jgi:hypothetical protein